MALAGQPGLHADLPIALVQQALERLEKETNTAAANWLMQQLQTGVTLSQKDATVEG